VLALVAAPAGGAQCVTASDALKGMSRVELMLQGPAGRVIELTARMADDSRERAAGFQHICPETIRDTAIYFQFPRPRRPHFHMRNVKAPLDIAFIDAVGVIVDIQRMAPYVLGAAREVFYSPPVPVMAALEARAGYFTDHGVTAGDWRVVVRQP